MSDLLPPAGMTLEAVSAAVASVLSVRERPARARDRSFYDTFDGRVRAAGRTVEYSHGRLAVVERNGAQADGAARRVAEPMRRPRRPLLASELPHGPLRQALAPIVGVRALTPSVRVHTRERALDVLDDERKTVVRLALASPVVLAPDRSLVLLAPRVTVAGVRGYEDERERVRGALVHDLEFTAAERDLVDDAASAIGLSPDAVRATGTVALERGEPAAAAARAVLARQLELIRLNLPGTVADVDTEFLHVLRVCVRRSRAVQRELAPVFEPVALVHWRSELRWLQAVTGAARDLDVWELEWDQYRSMVAAELRDDLDPLLEVLSARRRRAFLAMRRALGSERLEALLDGWAAFLEAPCPDSGAAPIEEMAGARIRKLYRRMVRMGSAIDSDSPAEALHDLRKQGKELRYLLELFSPLFEDAVTRPLVKALRSLQDVLGRHQDRAVQVALLHSLVPELAGRREGTDAVVAMGALMQRLLDDERDAREEFAECFAGFASRSQRRLVTEALR